MCNDAKHISNDNYISARVGDMKRVGKVEVNIACWIVLSMLAVLFPSSK